MLSINAMKEQLKDKIKSEENSTRTLITSCKQQISNKLNPSTPTLTEKPFACTQCDKKFKQQTSLKCHMNLHTGKHCFKCTYCERIFPRKITWIEHERCHTGETPYNCSYCSKKFKQKSCLHYHELHHRGIKNHICKECGKSFVMSTALKIHMRTHTGEKPYRCELCEKVFAHKANLKYHVLQHVYYNRHRCVKCYVLFTTPKELQMHFDSVHKGRVEEVDFDGLKKRVSVLLSENIENNKNCGENNEIVVKLREKVKNLFKK